MHLSINGEAVDIGDSVAAVLEGRLTVVKLITIIKPTTKNPEGTVEIEFPSGYRSAYDPSTLNLKWELNGKEA